MAASVHGSCPRLCSHLLRSGHLPRPLLAGFGASNITGADAASCSATRTGEQPWLHLVIAQPVWSTSWAPCVTRCIQPALLNSRLWFRHEQLKSYRGQTDGDDGERRFIRLGWFVKQHRLSRSLLLTWSSPRVHSGFLSPSSNVSYLIGNMYSSICTVIYVLKWQSKWLVCFLSRGGFHLSYICQSAFVC